LIHTFGHHAGGRGTHHAFGGWFYRGGIAHRAFPPGGALTAAFTAVCTITSLTTAFATLTAFAAAFFPVRAGLGHVALGIRGRGLLVQVF
jgi:hypothetical protein